MFWWRQVQGRYAHTRDCRHEKGVAKKHDVFTKWQSDEFWGVSRGHVRISQEGRDTVTDTKSQRQAPCLSCKQGTSRHRHRRVSAGAPARVPVCRCLLFRSWIRRAVHGRERWRPYGFYVPAGLDEIVCTVRAVLKDFCYVKKVSMSGNSGTDNKKDHYRTGRIGPSSAQRFRPAATSPHFAGQAITHTFEMYYGGAVCVEHLRIHR